jgi:RNA polymerase sigma-70 factor (ECF subfamily)
MPPTDPHRLAYEILVRQHHRRLLGYALTLCRSAVEAEDLVQEAFLVAYRELARFDPSRDFAAWVRGIVRMKWLESHRRRERPVDDATLAALEEGHRRLEVREAESGADALATLRGCVAHLDDALRETVELFYLQELPCQAVAERTGVSVEAVRKRLQRARAALGDCLDRHLERP